MLRVGEIVFCREEHISWFSSMKWSAVNIIQVTLYRMGRFYLSIYMCMYVHTCIHITINETWGHEFGRVKEAYMGLSGWRKGKGEIIQLYSNLKSRRKKWKNCSKRLLNFYYRNKISEHAKYWQGYRRNIPPFIANRKHKITGYVGYNLS